MACTILTYHCNPCCTKIIPSCTRDEKCLKVTPWADLVIGIALLVIGLLGMQEVLSMSGFASNMLFGVGIGYLTVTLISVGFAIKKICEDRQSEKSRSELASLIAASDYSA